MPDDIGDPKRVQPAAPDREPPDLTALYEDEPIRAPQRAERVRPDEWRVAPSPEKQPPEEKPRQQPEDKTTNPAEAPLDPRDAARRKRRRRIILAVVAALLLAAIVGFGWYWYTTLRWYASTDDAYTQSDDVTIAPQVAGYVSELPVADNQRVAKGDLLLRIDPRPYQAAVGQAAADVASAEAGIRNIDAQISAQQAVIAQARADIAAAKANLTFSQQQYTRAYQLAQAGYGTVQAAQQAQADYLAKQAALEHDNGALAAAQKQLDVLGTQRGVAEANLKAKQAALAQSKLNLGYAEIRSPIAGAVGNRTVQIGQYVQPGQALMTIVPMGSRIYVVANFKETEIESMFRGERVEIDIDAFPGTTLHGTIDSLAPGSGAQFALLPPENATGNFTKIVQRVPVKIVLDDQDSPIVGRLRPGLSVTATVDTRQAPKDGRQTLVPPGAR